MIILILHEAILRYLNLLCRRALLWLHSNKIWNHSQSEVLDHFLCSYIFTVCTAVGSQNGKYIIYSCIRLRAILWRFYWKGYERCRNSRSAINIMCFDFSIFSVMGNRPEVLLRLGPGFYMILSTGFDTSIWTFNVLSDCMTGFYTHIQYTPPHTIYSHPHSGLSYRTKLDCSWQPKLNPTRCFAEEIFWQYPSHLSGPLLKCAGTVAPQWTSSVQLAALPGACLRLGFELLLLGSETHSSALH